MSLDTGSIEEQVDKLDILTINAERRAYMLYFLNNSEPSVPNSRSRSSSIDLESPSGSLRLPNGAGNGSQHSSDSSANSHRSLSSLKFFRKRRQHFDRTQSSDTTSTGSGGGKDSLVEETISSNILKKVTVTSLPQLFLAKYLGCTSCQGLKGVNAVRGPIDQLIEAVGHVKVGQDLPLINIVFSKSGIRADNHHLSKGISIPPLLLSIESVSYGVQDVKFCRVFALIIVKEVSNQKVIKAECHAFFCPNPIIARKMSLCLGLAYQSMTRRISGQEVYSIDLRSPSDLAQRNRQIRYDEADA